MSLNAIGIVAENPSRSIEFYSILGLSFKQFQQTEHYEATTESGLSLMLDSAASIKQLYPNWMKPTGSSAVVLVHEGNGD